MAGHMIAAYLKERGHQVFTTTRRISSSEVLYFDAAEDLYKISDIIRVYQPTMVVNCIGILNEDANEHKHLAVQLNSYLPHYLDSIAAHLHFKLFHISTDCVFSGTRGGYLESDTPDADTFYGRSKALGEVINDRSLTIRTSIIGPDMNPKGIGLLNWFMRQSGEVKGFSKVIWSGVSSLQLAKSVETLFSQDVTGLVHLVNNQFIDKFRLLELFAKYMHPEVRIVEDRFRISNKSLKNGRSDLNLTLPDYENMIAELSTWISAHPVIYPGVYQRANN